VALKATIYKLKLSIADIDKGYYADQNLTLARHPSETEERLMLRLLAFVLFASDSLMFTRGLSTDDEPDLWDRDLTGSITHWIELGTPDESRVRKGCARADAMIVLTYGVPQAWAWWEKLRHKLTRFDNLEVLFVSPDYCGALSALVGRSMDIQATLQEGQIWLSTTTENVALTPEVWKRRPG